MDWFFMSMVRLGPYMVNILGYGLALIVLAIGIFIGSGIFRMITHYPTPLAGDEGMFLGIVALWAIPFIIVGVIVGWFCVYRFIPLSICGFTALTIGFCFLTSSKFAEPELKKLEITDPFFLCASEFRGPVSQSVLLHMEIKVYVKDKTLEGFIASPDGRRHEINGIEQFIWRLDNGRDFELHPQIDAGGSIQGTRDWSAANSATAIIRVNQDESFLASVAFSKSCLPADVSLALDAKLKFTRKELLFRRWFRKIFSNSES
jgi:hypothetical protein